MPRELKEAFAAFAIATFLVAVAGVLARFVPYLDENLGGVAGMVFLLLTMWWAKRRKEDVGEAFGFRSQPRKRGVLIALGYILLVFPVFTGGFLVFYDLACASDSMFSGFAMPGMCLEYDGWTPKWPAFHWTLGEIGALGEVLAIQLVVIALPEELFFRGLIHELCERALPPKRRVLGGGVGLALILSSLLFALGHLAVTFDGRRLAVFFPGLVFGWMRSATGSILAGVFAHTASNLFIRLLGEVFLR